MSREQRELVAEAVRVHKGLRGSLTSALPFWPLGLPRWTDPWIALGLRTPQASYLTVWRRGPFDGGTGTSAETQPVVTLPVPHLRGHRVTADVLYPRSTATATASATATTTTGAIWDAAASTLSVELPRFPSACLIRLGTR
jgi:alpha-galactosidase